LGGTGLCKQNQLIFSEKISQTQWPNSPIDPTKIKNWDSKIHETQDQAN